MRTILRTNYLYFDLFLKDLKISSGKDSRIWLSRTGRLLGAALGTLHSSRSSFKKLRSTLARAAALSIGAARISKDCTGTHNS